MRYEDVAPVLRAGGRARRAAWKDSDVAGGWVELVPAHLLPDGRMVAEMLMVGYDGGLLRQFGGTSFDLLEAGDWEIVTDDVAAG